MKQAKYGLMLYLFLMIPLISNLLESVMIVHMHMQMPLLVFSGFLMAKFFLIKFPNFFKLWNNNGLPGILLFIIIWSYWMIPRSMDEALTIQSVEVLKFISLPFLAGVPLRDSWKKLTAIGKDIVYLFFILMLLIMAWVYIGSDNQICNNYLLVDQKTLGWGSLALSICLTIYFLQLIFVEKTEET